MKIKSRWLTGIFGRMAAFGIRSWMSTVRYESTFLDPQSDPVHPDCVPSIYVHWHEYMMIPLYLRGNSHVTILISQHRDADVLEEFAKWSGFDCIRGSSYRGGAAALRNFMQRDKPQHLVIAPDGPRGPRRQLSPGAVYLASKLGMPIVPIGFACDNAWRMNSWDRFSLLKPFSTARTVMGEPIRVAPDLDRQGIELVRQELESRLNELTEVAEQWSQTQAERPGTVLSQRPRREIAPIKFVSQEAREQAA